MQRTLQRSAVVCGRGYWSGHESRVVLHPAPADAGVVFVRGDTDPPMVIPVGMEFHVDAINRTNLSAGGLTVQMVEHVLSALAGLCVDCCRVVVSSEELPGMDGSAQAFVEAIDAAGLVDLDLPQAPLVIEETIRVGDDTCWIEAGPPRFPGLTIDYQLDYGPGVIGRQRLEIDVTPQNFRRELAGARTFISAADAASLKAAGLGLTVTEQDLIVFGPHGPLNNPLRWADECVRHKMLDVVGDLALAGRPLQASVRACRSGHRLNAEMVARMLEQADTQRVALPV